MAEPSSVRFDGANRTSSEAGPTVLECAAVRPRAAARTVTVWKAGAADIDVSAVPFTYLYAAFLGSSETEIVGGVVVAERGGETAAVSKSDACPR